MLEWHKKYCEYWRNKMRLSHYGIYWLSFLKGVLLVLVVLALTGCSIGTEKRIKLFQIEEPKPKLNLDKPAPISLDELRWIIITSDNADEVFAKLEADGYDPVLFGLTDKEYELIAKNFAKIRNHLMETNEMLDKYKEYYEENKSEQK
jgi:hypothetical protein